MQQNVAALQQTTAVVAVYAPPLKTLIPCSLIFFLSVFRFNPSTSAARIWLPRVAATDHGAGYGAPCPRCPTPPP